MKRYLTDTNILVAVSLGDREVLSALDKLEQLPSHFVISLQNVCEFWNVSTRPDGKNGLGLSPDFTRRALDKIQLGFEVLPETDAVRQELLALLQEHRIRGKQIYDARLAATVRAHRLDGILTFNERDFLRYPGVNPIRPSVISHA